MTGVPPPLLPMDVSALTALRQPFIKSIKDLPLTIEWPDGRNGNGTLHYVLFMVAYGDGAHFVSDLNIPADYWGDDVAMPGWYRYDSQFKTAKRRLQLKKRIPRSPSKKRIDWVWYARA